MLPLTVTSLALAQQNVGLREINLSWNRLRTKGCKALAEGLAGNVSIQVPKTKPGPPDAPPMPPFRETRPSPLRFSFCFSPAHLPGLHFFVHDPLSRNPPGHRQ